MATDLIRYDLLVQEALRSVVRKVLSDAARDGLQGEHHFYITFKTHAPGVRLSTRMRNQYPNEMTIILQHQFWGLNVLEQGFEVGLSFQKIPETLFIPFDALTGFFDPSVQFGLKFESEIGANDVEGPLDPARTAESSQDIAAVASDGEKSQAAGGTLGFLPGARADEGAADAAPQSEEAKVISIDAFRKKP
jgi:uncharacterized protein